MYFHNYNYIIIIFMINEIINTVIMFLNLNRFVYMTLCRLTSMPSHIRKIFLSHR